MGSDAEDSEYLHSLHPGHIIEYYDYATLHSTQNIIKATVSSIDDSCFGDNELTVKTSKFPRYPIDIQRNDSFRIVSSIYKDAPMSGQWTSLKKVNLVKGNYFIPRVGDNLRKEIAVTSGGKDLEVGSKSCAIAKDKKKRKNQEYYKMNKKKILKKRKINYEENREVYLEKEKINYKENKEIIKKKKKINYEENKETILKKRKSTMKRTRKQFSKIRK